MMKAIILAVAIALCAPAAIGIVDMWCFSLAGQQLSWVDWTLPRVLFSTLLLWLSGLVWMVWIVGKK